MKNLNALVRAGSTSFVALTAALLIAAPARAQVASAVIDNGTVALGVNDTGELITSGVGLTFLASPAGSQDALTPGCACEAWGVGDYSTIGDPTPFFGNAGQATGDRNLSNATLTVSGTGTDPRSSGSSALSTVDVSVAGSSRMLTVSHDYHPSVDSHLYQVDVSIRNTGTTDITELRYRRAMDWDIPPTEFSEFVTIQGLPATNIVATSDNGFANGNPLETTGSISAPENTNFDDNGPADHGATFDFNFGALAVGDTRKFVIFYGAAASEADALAALRAVGAEVYSLGQPSSTDGDTLGIPNTYIFAFAGVGGTPLGSAADVTPLYVDVPLLITNDHFSNVGLRLSGHLGGGESTLTTVAAMLDGSAEGPTASSGGTTVDSLFGVQGLHGFVATSYAGTKVSTQGGVLGGDVNGYDITAGVDYDVMRNEGIVDSALAGLAVGWSGFSTDVHDGGSTNDGHAMSLIAYGSATMLHALNVDAFLGYSWISYSAERLSGGPGNYANADIDGSDLGAQINAAYDINIPTGIEKTTFIVSPHAVATYHNTTIDSYDESGFAARHVDGYSSDSLTSELGLHGQVGLPVPGVDQPLLLRIGAGWVHEYLNDAYVVHQSIGAVSLTADSGKPDRDYARFTGGLAMPVNPGVAVGLDYEGTYGNSVVDHQLLTLRARLAF
ncbi:autotransporter outer membrane beta-barrel domain-containing protein [Zavarzinia sp.]|uniref:autotransporter family protein n=1 Tax=Zavarzinia sp. TaxID=2027920 RepID=UPI0035640131